MVTIKDSKPWVRLSWAILKWSTLIGFGLGFAASALSLLSANTISINGNAIGGWAGVWTVTLACGLGGFLFGVIWALVFRAIAIASGR
ncbi:hypothetical protein FHW17_003613 [Phyllobacterium sp. P30BS-XVII]|nr:hypothetical protein [Phyllobacterium sp. P30BS-XVII]